MKNGLGSASRVSVLHPDPDRSNQLGEALREEGHQVRLVAPGATAVEEVWAHAPELVVAHGSQRLEPIGGIPVIRLLATATEDDEADLALPESVTPEVVCSCVRGLLRACRETRQLQRRIQDVTALCKLSWALSIEAGPQQLCGYLAKQAALLLAADRGLVLTYDPERRWIEGQVPGYGIPDELVERICYAVDAASAERWHFRRNGPLLSADAAQDPRLSPNLMTALGVHSVLIVPMVRGGSILGLLAVADPTLGGCFDEQDVDLLLAAGGLAAVALENSEEHGRVKQANEVLRERDRVKSGFLGMVAHDYRRPLTAIRGFAEIVLVDDPPPETVQTYMKAIVDEAEGLARLAEDTLLVTKLETANIEYRWAEVELAALVREVVPTDLPRHSFAVEVPQDAPKLLADPQRLRQVLSNLVSNAVNYSPEGGAVRVKASYDGDEVTISVSDSGLGIPAEQQPGLFQRFTRVQTGEHRAVSGSGLGLYISRLIVAGHGGRIWVESEPGHGSTFHVNLPLDPRTRRGPATLAPGRAPESVLSALVSSTTGPITRMFRPPRGLAPEAPETTAPAPAESSANTGAAAPAAPTDRREESRREDSKASGHAERRDTQRIRKVVPIKVSYEGVTLMTYTAVINRDGAMIVCTIPIPIGTSLLVTNLSSSHTAEFEVVSSGEQEAGLHKIGIQLTGEGDFWGSAYEVDAAEAPKSRGSSETAPQTIFTR